MLRKQYKEVQWLEFTLLQPYPHVVHGTFLRHGGLSPSPFASLNFGEDVGDHPDFAKAHRKVAQKILGISHLVYARQYHSSNLFDIQPMRKRKVPYGDGLMTQSHDLGLMIKHADCQAALFYDPKNDAIANVHCGWRGNVQNIYAKAIQQMQSLYGSRPQDLIACLSPSLGPQAAQFIHYQQELPPELWPFQVAPAYFDFWQISRWQLMQAGILPEHIEVASLCTYSHPDDFFSYRRDQTTGRHATIIALVS